MLDSKDFFSQDNQINFDFKGFFIKIGSYWKLFVIALSISFFIAYQINIRKQKTYNISNSISLKEENNPFFTSNTSLTFNWGGSSDQMQSITSKLKSRSHNEQVVEKLQYYINYYTEDKYFNRDVYGKVPFTINIDKTKGQLLDQNVKIKFISANKYQIQVDFNSENAALFNYSKNTSEILKIANQSFKKNYKVGEIISLPFLKWKLEIVSDFVDNYIGNEYIIVFRNFDATVANYQQIKVSIDKDASSLLNLSMEGTNKFKLVTYLNETVNTLINNELEKKNLFATNTIKFIDSTLNQTDRQLKLSGDELKNFQYGKNVFDIKSGGVDLSGEFKGLDLKKENIERKLNYSNSLKTYLLSNNDFSKLPAPSVAGIEDANIIVNVSRLISLSVERSKMPYTIKNEKLFQDIDNEIYSYKLILIENLNDYNKSIRYDLNLTIAKLNEADNNIQKFPESQQKYSKIQRKLLLNESVYNNFLSKKSEAEIVKASNLSDIHFLDTAKDIGGGMIESRKDLNYVLALLMGIFIPLIFISIILLTNNLINNVDDISRMTKIPLIGIIGKNISSTNLAVLEKPKSPISEAFRSIRSSLQFIYKKNNINGAKTLMITSSVGREGKTFCAINFAIVFALSDKKTVIIGLDLRKPKIFQDFGLTNEIGIVNYIIGEKTLDEIIYKSKIPNLDIITSGPTPPNPSEMIMSQAMSDLFGELKQKYDYIIIDTPPVGLVTDALELAHFTDITLYIVRQNFTKKEMINLLNTKVQRGELENLSIVLNSFENRAKYGYAYGNGYDYGYGNYSNSYYEKDKSENVIQKFIKKIFSSKLD